MPFQVVWANDEKTIIHEIYSGVLTPDEYLLASEETNSLLTSVTHMVDVIADGREITVLRGNLLVAAHRVSRKTAPNQGIIVAVKPDQMIEVLIAIISRLFPTLQIYMTKTIEEAFTLIETTASKRKQSTP